MIPQRYPIGVQTFSKLIEEGYTYVDKTAFIPLLMDAGQYIFLSRPRRFGKSLLLSTLEAYFDGRRDLFDGLAIEEMNVEWKKRPVIHIDLNAQDYSEENGLHELLNYILSQYEEKYEIPKKEESLSVRFAALIKGIFNVTGEKIVILVDEYDKPLLNLEDRRDLFERNQSLLKGFFGVLKSMDQYIRFAMLTGVARFHKVSIFSDLNNLNDISMDNDFADICGWTEDELLKTFRSGIERLAEDNNKSYEDIISILRDFYDGYLFAARGSRLYNPYSVLKALSSRQIRSYWFQSATPTFLVKRVKKSGILLSAIDGSRAAESQLVSVVIDDPNPIPILFQTGYLTIDKVSGQRYELKFPNKEVEIGFAENLLPLYVAPMTIPNGPFSIWDFQDELAAGKPEQFMKRLQAMLKAVPYEKHDEQLYQNAIYLLFTLLGTDARLEEHSNLGSTDLTVRTKDYIYIFEFKYNKTAQIAISQIHSRDYAGRFAADNRTVYLIGANFSHAARGLEDWTIETYLQ